MTYHLTVLGTATPYPRRDRACSGYLLRTPAASVWVDAGSGSLANLLEHTSPDRLDAIWISHTHADHTADLLPTYYALRFADLTPARPVPLYGPPGLADRLEAFLASTGPNPASAAFEVHDLYDGHHAEVGDLTLVSHAVEHGVPAFGLRASQGDVSFAFSGDTGPCRALDELADGADLFLCESEGSAANPVHCTPEAAVRAGRGAGRTMLTHIGPTLSETEATERASVPVVHEGETHAVAG